MKNLKSKVALVVSSVVIATAAHAELPAAVGTSLTALQTDAGSLMTLLYPVMIAITGAFIIFGLVKKGMKKAA